MIARDGAARECSVCGYVYEPALGDEAARVSPGTDFHDLPEDWSCPRCAAERWQFLRCAESRDA